MHAKIATHMVVDILFPYSVAAIVISAAKSATNSSISYCPFDQQVFRSPNVVCVCDLYLPLRKQ
jgi:hypothetical protein